MRPLLMTIASALFLGTLASGCGGCRTDGKGTGPPVPASSDPEGKDLVEGAIVAAEEKTGGVRLYKIKEVKYFPPPMSDELVMLAFNEKANDFKHAADLWRRRKFTIAVANARVQRHMFITRDYRVIDREPVTELDRKLEVDEPFK
jgi:hypothetical protein